MSNDDGKQTDNKQKMNVFGDVVYDPVSWYCKDQGNFAKASNQTPSPQPFDWEGYCQYMDDQESQTSVAGNKRVREEAPVVQQGAASSSTASAAIQPAKLHRAEEQRAVHRSTSTFFSDYYEEREMEQLRIEEERRKSQAAREEARRRANSHEEKSKKFNSSRETIKFAIRNNDINALRLLLLPHQELIWDSTKENFLLTATADPPALASLEWILVNIKPHYIDSWMLQKNAQGETVWTNVFKAPSPSLFRMLVPHLTDAKNCMEKYDVKCSMIYVRSIALVDELYARFGTIALEGILGGIPLEYIDYDPLAVHSSQKALKEFSEKTTLTAKKAEILQYNDTVMRSKFHAMRLLARAKQQEKKIRSGLGFILPPKVSRNSKRAKMCRDAMNDSPKKFALFAAVIRSGEIAIGMSALALPALLVERIASFDTKVVQFFGDIEDESEYTNMAYRSAALVLNRVREEKGYDDTAISGATPKIPRAPPLPPANYFD